MSSTASSAAASSTTAQGGFLGLLNGGSGEATYESGETINTLLASIGVAAAGFGGQFAIFLLLRWRLTRVYQPKTYLVAERERVPVPDPGPWQWIKPLWTTSNATLIDKCGLDAYFFLRYLRMLLKLFVPLALLILPILLPINRYSGGGAKGLDKLGWQNVSPANVNRLWAHLVLSLVVIVWYCYLVCEELRGYIRIRQAYLTSPQHRIKASATTVLVSAIPRKWLTLEALSGLYDVFPGGIRNIWINRNFDELYQKVQKRNGYARKLESAETALVRKCAKAHIKDKKKMAKQVAKTSGHKRARSKEDKKNAADVVNARAMQMATGNGVSSGDPHHTPHNLHEALDEIDYEEQHKRDTPTGSKIRNPLLLVGHGINAFGNVGRQFVGEVTADVNIALKNVNKNLDAVNTGQGFMSSDSPYRPRPLASPQAPRGSQPISSAAGTTTSLDTVPESRPPTESRLPTEVCSPTEFRPLTAVRPPTDGRPTTDVRPTTEGRSLPAYPKPMVDNGDHQRDVYVRQSEHFHAQRRSVSAGKPTGLRKVSDVAVLDRPLPVPPKGRKHAEMADERSSSESISYEKSRPRLLGHDGANDEQDKHLSPWARLLNFREESPIPFPSPQPHVAGENEYPLGDLANRGTPDSGRNPPQRIARSKWVEQIAKVQMWKRKQSDELAGPEYPHAYDEALAEDQDGEPRWKNYIEVKDRATMREPLAKWLPRLPLLGKKIDKIYFLRKELARLNIEVSQDQANVEKYPLMNSAFIQFNHQVAAHMACQSLSHHVPQQMAPRLIEIAPGDILWENMSIMWWERYLRFGYAFVACCGLIILYAVPVTFTGFLSQVTYLANLYSWLSWLTNLPSIVIAVIQGVVSPTLLSIILMLVPIIFRALVHQQGVATGNQRELGVANYYFYFLFIQVFLIASISSSLTTFISNTGKNPLTAVTALGEDLPKSSNYFFSYLIVQALGNSASALLQVQPLLVMFLWAPKRDTTARQKWYRQTNLQNVQWGSFFPTFGNFALIGLVFSVISPLILVFVLISFSLYWIVYRYNILYVYQFHNDTGGLLFPQALNQLFTGLYTMEICLIGLFFLATNDSGDRGALPQAIIMIVCLVFTIIYHVLLNGAFQPAFRYLPITLEDEAVIRDEQFARAQRSKWQGLTQEEAEDDGEDVEDRLERREREEEDQDRRDTEAERRKIREHRRSRSPMPQGSPDMSKQQTTWKHDPWRKTTDPAAQPVRGLRQIDRHIPLRKLRRPTAADESTPSGGDDNDDDGDDTDSRSARQRDPESQRVVGDVLFSGVSDELEDLTPAERDTLVRYSFQHSALRARRPVVWIPRDHLGVSDDEIARCKRMSTVGARDGEKRRYGGEEGAKDDDEHSTSIWISNEGTALDAGARVVFRRSPPDFANVDLVSL